MPAEKKDEVEGGPLSFLDRLLDEERDSNMFLGDVRFWKHLDHIDVPRIYTTKSLEYRTMKLMVLEAIFYLILLIVFTCFLTEVHSSTVYESRRQQLDYWGGCRRAADGSREDGPCEINRITDTKKLMDWIHDTLIPKAFTEQDDYPTIIDSPAIYSLDSETMSWAPRFVGDTRTAILIGTIRVRQLRVQYNKGCTIQTQFEGIQENCFAAFADDLQSRISWAPTWTPDFLISMYEWSPSNFTQQISMAGMHGDYPGDGFFFDMPLNRTAALKLVHGLRTWDWLDTRTRAVVIEMSTLNPNVNVFVHNRMLFEHSAMGNLEVTHEAFAFQALHLSLPLMLYDKFGVFFFWAATNGLFILLLVYVIFVMYMNGIKLYFSYFWSWLDVCILVLFLCSLVAQMIVYTNVGGEPNFQSEVVADPEIFFPIAGLVVWMDFSESMLSILGLLTWFKVLKYCCLIATFQGLARIIGRCLKQLAVFGSFIVIIVIGFALAFHISYGDVVPIFATFNGAFFACLLAPSGGVDFEPVFSSDYILGPILCFAYLIICLFLLLNTFMAIVVDVYTVTMYQLHQSKKEKPGDPLKAFLYTYWNALKGVKLVGHEVEDDKGEPDEQWIPLACLPEALSKRYLEEEDRMRQIVDEAEYEVYQHKQARLADQARADGMAGIPGQSSGAPALPAIPTQDTLRAIRDCRPSEMPATVAPPRKEENVTVSRVQLQRMLDDDPVLQGVCGTSRAVDIVRRFRVDDSAADPYEAVTKLQAAVVKKLTELEEQSSTLGFNEFDTLRAVATELHSAVTDAQKEWRAELMSVLQMADLLSHTLIDLTGKLAEVQTNHRQMSELYPLD